MRKEPGFRKVEIFPKRIMQLLGAKHIPIFIKRVKRGIDAKGRVFTPYDSEYAEYKASRFRSKREGNSGRIPSMAGKRIKSTRTHPPDLTVTGNMLDNIKRKRYAKDHYTIGFTGEQAEKVDYNARMGRDIASDIPNKEKQQLVRLLSKDMKKYFRTTLKDVTIYVDT